MDKNKALILLLTLFIGGIANASVLTNRGYFIFEKRDIDYVERNSDNYILLDSELEILFVSSGTLQGLIAALEADKVNRVGSDAITGDLRVNGALFQGKKTNVQIQGLTCAGGVGDCFVISSDEGDIYISTGSAVNQYRNSRTGVGP